MKPESVLNAVKLIKTGEVIELSHPLNAQMPLAAGGSTTCRSSAPPKATSPTSARQ